MIKVTKLVQPIYDAAEGVGLKVVDSFLDDPIGSKSKDLQDPPVQDNPTLCRSDPEPREIYTRHFVLAMPHGKRLLDKQNICGLAKIMQSFGAQFSRNYVTQFYHDIGLSAEHTTERLGFTNNGSRGDFRVRYYFPDVTVFQKIGQRTERQTIESEYPDEVLESIALELDKPPIKLGQPKKVETKKPVYIENTFKIFPNEELLRELADKMKKIDEGKSLYDNPYRVNIYGAWPKEVCSSIDVEAGKYLFPQWREILRDWEQEPRGERK